MTLRESFLLQWLLFEFIIVLLEFVREFHHKALRVDFSDRFESYKFTRVKVELSFRKLTRALGQVSDEKSPLNRHLRIGPNKTRATKSSNNKSSRPAQKTPKAKRKAFTSFSLSLRMMNGKLNDNRRGERATRIPYRSFELDCFPISQSIHNNRSRVVVLRVADIIGLRIVIDKVAVACFRLPLPIGY